jgi:hypothetical protein
VKHVAFMFGHMNIHNIDNETRFVIVRACYVQGESEIWLHV